MGKQHNKHQDKDTNILIKSGINLDFSCQLSDNVINRMKLSPKGSTPLILSEPQTSATTPGPASPVQSLSPPLPQEASPPSQPLLTKLALPPVKFHSLPPSSVEPVESTSPAEAQTCPFVSSAQSKTPAVPEYPVSVVESVTPTHSKLEAQTPAPVLEQTAELLNRSPGEETPPAFEPSSQTPAVTIQPAAAAEPLESAAPSPAEPASLSPTLESAQVESLLPSAPSEAAETTPCAAPPAVVTDVPSVLEPPAGPASQPPASLEETSPPCHDEPSAVPTEESFGKFTASPLPDPTLPAGGSTMSTSGPPQDEDEEPFCPVSPPTAGWLTLMLLTGAVPNLPKPSLFSSRSSPCCSFLLSHHLIHLKSEQQRYPEDLWDGGPWIHQ